MEDGAGGGAGGPRACADQAGKSQLLVTHSGCSRVLTTEAQFPGPGSAGFSWQLRPAWGLGPPHPAGTFCAGGPGGLRGCLGQWAGTQGAEDGSAPGLPVAFWARDLSSEPRTEHRHRHAERGYADGKTHTWALTDTRTHRQSHLQASETHVQGDTLRLTHKARPHKRGSPLRPPHHVR